MISAEALSKTSTISTCSTTLGVRTQRSRGKKTVSCGDTCIFYDKCLVPEYDFYLDNAESASSRIFSSFGLSGDLGPLPAQCRKASSAFSALRSGHFTTWHRVGSAFSPCHRRRLLSALLSSKISVPIAKPEFRNRLSKISRTERTCGMILSMDKPSHQ